MGVSSRSHELAIAPVTDITSIEKIGKAKKAKSELKGTAKESTKVLSGLVKDVDNTQWKRDVLLGRRKAVQDEKHGSGLVAQSESPTDNSNKGPANLDTRPPHSNAAEINAHVADKETDNSS